MLRKGLWISAVLSSPLCLAWGTLASPKLAHILTGLLFIGVPIPAVLAGALLILSALYSLAVVDLSPVVAVLGFA